MLGASCRPCWAIAAAVRGVYGKDYWIGIGKLVERLQDSRQLVGQCVLGTVQRQDKVVMRQQLHALQDPRVCGERLIALHGIDRAGANQANLRFGAAFGTQVVAGGLIGRKQQR